MPSEQNSLPPGLLRRILRIQFLTLLWMILEALVSLGSAWQARSPALFAFGGDSAVELASAALVFFHFYSPSSRTDASHRVAKLAGSLLFVLAAFVAAASLLALWGRAEPRPSPVGILILGLASLVMPWLAARKRRLAVLVGSAALRADAAESAACGYLALVALAGLLVNALWRIRWADPFAALALLPWIVREGWESVKGEPACD